ncbi:MAG TPA: ECF-type sigma factor [Thermoanaerobaculia bacterium]|nr:ECF-type sigma factor [Thermoanaerobaculia bacterium]
MRSSFAVRLCSSIRQARIVELRFFTGLKHEEIADHLRVSVTTLTGEWNSARLWLYRELRSCYEISASSAHYLPRCYLRWRLGAAEGGGLLPSFGGPDRGFSRKSDLRSPRMVNR